jgi:Zn-dependent protease
MALVRLSGHPIGVSLTSDIPFEKLGVEHPFSFSIAGLHLYWGLFRSIAVNVLLYNILLINILWGLVNLLPVYPLDGGRVSRELCTLKNPRRGIALSLQISIVAAVGMAAYGAIQWQSLLVPLMFGYLAYGSYQTLQAYQRNYW